MGHHHSQMLRAKLRAPQLPAYFIHRRRLHDLLDGIASRPLTTVIAPAGSGKTLLVSGWVAESSLATSWLSLDEADRDESQFWFEIMAALEQLAPGCAQEAKAELSHGRPIADVVAQLLDDLDSITRHHCVLVVDDAHLVDDTVVSVSLSTFIQHQPSWLHVVLLSRTDLSLPIDRWRGRGQLAEVRFAELRFSFAETCEMLKRLVPNLTDEELSDAATRSDGWAAGVQLSALAARSSFARPDLRPPRVETHVLVEDYVWHEVLNAAEQEVVDVLLSISVVDRVNGGLATALTDRADAGDLLLRAEARGLFVARLGSDDGWFRIHPLVRAILLDELTRRSRHLDQHRRAAQWLEGAGETSDALDQWLLAGQPREALRLLVEATARLYDTGRESVIRRTIAAIPHSATAADVPALLSFAFSNILVNRRIFVQVVEEATWWAERSTIDDSVRAQLLMLQSMVASVLGNWKLTGPLAREAIAMMGRGGCDHPYGKFAWNAVARGAALLERWSDESDDVRDAVLATSRDPERGLSLEGVRAVGEALAGRPVDAIRVASGVRHTAPTMSILCSELAIAEAIAHRELGDRATAMLELGTIVETPSEPTMYCRVLAALELVAARLEDRDLTAASEWLARARALVAHDNIGTDMRNWFGRAETLVAIAIGALDDAWQMAESIDDPFWGPVSRGRVLLERNERSSAWDVLAAAEPRCVRHQVVLGLLRARSNADSAEALILAADALKLASSNLLLQTVASECRDSMELVERVAWCVQEDWMDRLRRAATHDGGPRPLDDPHQVEPLTDRERDVLRLLPSRLTLREIASELYVSVNTLKFHLRVIYRKLGVNSREEAAALARSMTSVRPTASR
jgi:ATP/maltotriose-dependent transcriptional regulator MalT